MTGHMVVLRGPKPPLGLRV